MNSCCCYFLVKNLDDPRLDTIGQGGVARDKESKEMVERNIDRIGMIAAGSGITPMFQLIQTVADSPADSTALSLIYSNRTPVSKLALFL